MSNASDLRDLAAPSQRARSEVGILSTTYARSQSSWHPPVEASLPATSVTRARNALSPNSPFGRVAGKIDSHQH